MEDTFCDMDVHGSGLVARAMALGLARLGHRVGVSAQPQRFDRLLEGAGQTQVCDVRAFAITPSSKLWLDALGVWPSEQGEVTPVLDMRVRDGASMIHFNAAELGVEALAWMLAPAALAQRLDEALAQETGVFRRSSASRPLGQATQLDVICEGAASRLRAELAIEGTHWDYGQQAIATQLSVEAAHELTARQWFHGGEILAFLPMGASQFGNRVAVVWSVSLARARALMALDNAQFVAELQMLVQPDRLGGLSLKSDRQIWPLVADRAHSFSGTSDGHAWVLAGDAAHRVHPMAGLGLNLGLGDAAALCKVMAQRRGAQHWRKVSDAKLLRQYARQRQAKAQQTLAVTDGLFHLMQAPPVHAPWVAGPLGDVWPRFRQFGVQSMGHSGPLKRWLANQAMR